ncbi:MAG: V-type ATP synthase subunit F [Candidatus Aenigmarchaeota archaeon]|nr:V-type ATP synthase subunit F [Candidatus Aenigmarchaeota archaeon]
MNEKNRIVVVGDEPTVVGFRLAGVKDTYIVENQKEAETVLKQLIEDETVGIVILPDTFTDYSESMKKILLKTSKPIVVEVPTKETLGKTETIDELVKKVIGVDLSKGGTTK